MATVEKSVNERIRDLGIKGYDDRVFGRSSEGGWNYSGAVRFAERDGGRLQSLRDAVVYRIASNGADFSCDNQHTCDLALYLNLDGFRFTIFVEGYDFHDREGRSLIHRIPESFRHVTPTSGYDWLLPISEIFPDIRNLDYLRVWCDTLVENGRCIAVPDDTLKLPLETAVDDVYFVNHQLSNLLLGRDIAGAFSDYLLSLRTKNCLNLYIQFCDRDVPEGSISCRPVVLKKDNCIDVGSIWRENGCARSVNRAQIEVAK